ncbi:MAG: hypothetical protein ACYTE6_11790 [Planctomycetota bacterium]|jgi:hypothetical protein
MAKRHIGPALYELMRGRRPEPREAEPPPPETAAWGSLSPGRTVRLPIGYLLLAAAVILVAVVVAFTVGYGRGQDRTKTEFEQQWLASNEQTVVVPPPEAVGAAPPRPAPARPEPADTTGAEPARGTPEWGQILSDPREAGKNYFVLIHTRRESAVRFAEFSREHGVEAYVIRAKNLSLYKVVALPGYGRGERSADFVLALERRIEEVARKWKLQVNPRDELSHYPEKYEG